jgi:hypothetical protein
MLRPVSDSNISSTVGVNLFNLLLWVVGPFDLFTLGTAWAVTVPVMAASHVLFNMRLAYHDPPSSTLNLEVDTEFQVAQRPHGASGPTVWSSSSKSAFCLPVLGLD